MIIPKHKTWHIIDSSKLQSLSRCQRKVFFRSILGWETENPSIHLVHGEAWHRGMEYILLNAYDEESVNNAMQLYLAYYREFFSETMDSVNDPKTPGNAYTAYMSYIDQYRETDAKNEVLFTEVAGSVSIGKDRKIHFRLDSIIQNNTYHKKESLEHKTGSRNSAAWRDQWIQKIQIGTYTHVLYCLYGPENVFGVRVNGSFFYKSQPHAHVRIPIRKTNISMQEWLWTVNQIVDTYEFELERLEDCKESDDIMKAFPKNTEACMDFNTRCPYFDTCMSHANPLKIIDQPPVDMKVDFWDPSSREIDATNIFKDNAIKTKEV